MERLLPAPISREEIKPGNMKGLAAAREQQEECLMQSKGQAGAGAAKKGSKGRGSSSKMHPVLVARFSPGQIFPGDSLTQNLQSTKGCSWGTSHGLHWGG